MLHLLTAAVVLAAADAPPPKRATPDVLLVHEGGLVYLAPDGSELEKLGPDFSNGTLSLDGRWLACLQYEKADRTNRLALRPRDGKGPPVVVPDVTLTAGENCQLVWSPDAGRLLISEMRAPMRAVPEYRYRIYDVASKKLSEVKLPEGFWPADWAKDGKRLLGAMNEGQTARVAFINADGGGMPEFVSPEDELVDHPRLAPDGRKILYKATPRLDEGWGKPRLYVQDLATKKRVAVDDPGEAVGFCWSPDGSRLAYTWQRALRPREYAPERETLLITCDAEGKERKTIAVRKYKPLNPRTGVMWYFELVDWR